MGLFSKSSKSSGGGNNTPDEDPNRAALFGSRKPAAAPQAQGNQYTSAPPDSYNSYGQQQGRNNGGGYGQNGGSSGQSNGGYGGGGYGGGNSYGGGYQEPSGYGASEPTSYGGGSYGGGGYGASTRGNQPPMQRQASNTTYDSNRDALFGNRQKQALAQPPVQDQDSYSGGAPTGAGAYSQSSGYGAQGSYGGGGYGGGYSAQAGYDPKNPYDTGPTREMNQEQEEEEDADALKQQIRFTKQESVSSTRNALRAAARAEEVGRDTLTRLGEQGEKLYETELNLELAKNHGDIAGDQAKKLKSLNRSMFAPHIKNPIGSAKRTEREEAAILEKHQMQREERERIQRAGMEGRTYVDGQLKPMGGPNGGPRAKMSLAEKARYQFEADEEDDQMEEEIDDNLRELHLAAQRLNGLAKATNKVVTDQDIVIRRLDGQTTQVDDRLATASTRLKKFGF